MKKKSIALGTIDIATVQSRMLTIRNQQVLLDRDVAALYGVKTKALNQAVKRNAEKFPTGYILKMTDEECSRSQNVTLNGGRGSNLKYLPYAFTERGLYMLATVLKSTRATQATLAIIETYAQVRSMVRDMEAIQTEKVGSPEQANLLTRAGHKLAELIGDNLSTVSRKTTIELNLALLKITHEVTQGKDMTC
ncbi:MAG: ORF6N domain-containing protein [Kiritimatiellae bacterium]|nr:ORF6N domain-containing protein [Kiritimatiellia bacterium]